MTLIAVGVVWTKAKTKKKKKVDSLFQDARGKGKEKEKVNVVSHLKPEEEKGYLFDYPLTTTMRNPKVSMVVVMKMPINLKNTQSA